MCSRSRLVYIWFGIVRSVLCVGVLVTCGCHRGIRSHSTQEVPRVEWTIELTGSGLGKPIAFTFEQLARMEMTRLDNVLMQKTHGPDEMTSWRGVPLDALLAAAQIKPGPMTVLFEAPDGYKIRCSREELRSAILALMDGSGQWLSELDAAHPIRLVPPDKTGDYWMANPGRITVEPVADAGPST